MKYYRCMADASSHCPRVALAVVPGAVVGGYCGVASRVGKTRRSRYTALSSWSCNSFAKSLCYVYMTSGKQKGAAAARRAEMLRDELARIVRLLSARSDVERVIQFGSAARGQVRAGSDLDLLIVQRTTLRFLDRLDEIYRFLVPQVACDILVYTPEEFERLKTESRFVARAAREGVTVHAA